MPTDWNLARTRSTIAGAVSGADLLSDPTSDIPDGRSRALAGAGGVVQIGVVVRAGVGGYDCAARIGSREVACQLASNVVSPTYGYSLGFIPPEGTRVVILLPSRNATRGYVIGSVPFGFMAIPNGDRDTPTSLMYCGDHSEGSSPEVAGYSHYAAFKNPYTDPHYISRICSPNNRPADVLHGEVALLNEHNCGFFGGSFSANLVGGGSYVKVSRIDDLVRIRSTNYQRWSDFVVEREYNDGGRISSERYEHSYQGERYGLTGLFPKDVIADSSAAPALAHPRVKSFGGYFGGVRTEFVERPDKDRTTKALLNSYHKPKEEGVMSSHVSEDGSVMLRSAGGISIERYDKIPSVTRVAMPWDPSGDYADDESGENKGRNDIKYEPIEPFKYNDSDRCVRPLELYDAMAWNQKCMYQRFDEYRKDFVAQQESDIDIPHDGNNDPMESKSPMAENFERRCGIYLGQDGSVTIRDAWGSEICMIGGNIQINAPGSIVMTANKSVVSMARESNVMKSNGIASVMSSKYVEMRGSRYVNIQGGYTGGNGGVLIESFGEEDQTNSMQGAGHDDSVEIHGIILKSASGVNMRGRDLRAMVDRNVTVACGDEGKRDGSVYFSTGSIALAAESTVRMGTGKSAVILNGEQANVVADGSVLVGSKSKVSVIQDTNQRIVASFTKISKSPVPSVIDNEKSTFDSLDPFLIGNPYTFDEWRKSVYSQLGTSGQYGTYASLGMSGGEFTMYAPYWHYMKRMGFPLLERALLEKWNEKDFMCYGNCAWPGLDAIEQGKFADLKESTNLENWYSKDRKKLKTESSVEFKDLSEFEI